MEKEVELAIRKLEAMKKELDDAFREVEEHFKQQPAEGPGRHLRRARERWLAQLARKKARYDRIYHEFQLQANRAKELIAAVERAKEVQ